VTREVKTVNYRRARDSDWTAVVTLQDANLAWNLSEEEKQSGFLSARLTAEEYREMNREGAVVIAEENGLLAGYACCASQAFSARAPILQAMMQEFPKLAYLGKPLNSAACVYGPVCVARPLRGKGVFRGLVTQLKGEIKGRYEVAVSFIGKSNQRSLSAHVDGLGMTILGDFRFDETGYWIVAFGVPPEAISCVVR
jgi:hypothetical protein